MDRKVEEETETMRCGHPQCTGNHHSNRKTEACPAAYAQRLVSGNARKRAKYADEPSRMMQSITRSFTAAAVRFHIGTEVRSKDSLAKPSLCLGHVASVYCAVTVGVADQNAKEIVPYA